MRCPQCREDTLVTDSRQHARGVRRRRRCPECGHRFSTLEAVAVVTPHRPRARLQYRSGAALSDQQRRLYDVLRSSPGPLSASELAEALMLDEQDYPLGQVRSAVSRIRAKLGRGVIRGGPEGYTTGDTNV